MNRRSIVATVAVGLVAALGMSACSGNSNPAATSSSSGDSAGGKQYTFAMITHGNAGDSFWSTIENGMNAAAKQEGVKVTYQAGGGDPAKQSQLIDNAVASHVDGLMVTLPNADALKSSLAKAEAAGIPVVTLNSGSDKFASVGAIEHVGQDESVAGQQAGEHLKEAGLHHVLCIVHEQGNVALEQRCSGVAKTFGGTVTNLQVQGNANITATQSSIKAALIADKSVDGVLTLNPDVAAAAIPAVASSGSKAKLATFEVSPEIISAIESGKIIFAVDQGPYLQGYLPVVLLSLYKRTGSIVGAGQPILTGPNFITQANAKQVAAEVKAGVR